VPTAVNGQRPIALLAVLAGFSVANLYSAQPLLKAMAQDLAMPPAWSGAVVAATQLGYALGLVVLVPLGDRLPRRQLLALAAAGTAAALAAVPWTTTALALGWALAVVGVLAVAIQLSVAFAADLAPSHSTGRAIGAVTAGVALGVVAARLLPGPIAASLGWRSVYAASAGIAAALAGLLWWRLPGEGTRPRPGTPMPGVAALVFNHPVLRQRGPAATVNFAMLGLLWTALPLAAGAASDPQALQAIPLIGLVGLAGALAAPWAGRAADSGHDQAVITGAALTACGAWCLLASLHSGLWGLIAGTALLDAAVQAAHVTHQRRLLRTGAHARSRLVAAYMLFYAAGTAAGATAATWLLAHGGWQAVCQLGVALGLASLAQALWLRRKASAAPIRSCP